MGSRCDDRGVKADHPRTLQDRGTPLPRFRSGFPPVTTVRGRSWRSPHVVQLGLHNVGLVNRTVPLVIPMAFVFERVGQLFMGVRVVAYKSYPRARAALTAAIRL